MCVCVYVCCMFVLCCARGWLLVAGKQEVGLHPICPVCCALLVRLCTHGELLYFYILGTLPCRCDYAQQVFV